MKTSGGNRRGRSSAVGKEEANHYVVSWGGWRRTKDDTNKKRLKFSSHLNV